MTRLPAPRPASGVICRHCGGAHSIAHCPDVLAAFGPVNPSELACKRCGRTVEVGPRVRHVVCQECIVSKEPEPRKKYERHDIDNAIYVVQSAEFVAGGYLRGALEALKQGALEPGMVVRYKRQLRRVHGTPGQSQKLVFVRRGNE